MRKAIGQDDPHRGRDQIRAGGAEIPQPLAEAASGITERNMPGEQRDRREEQVRRAMSARERLQREEPDRQQQMRALACVEIRMQECERERNPLHRGQVQLAEAEKSRWRERENQRRR